MTSGDWPSVAVVIPNHSRIAELEEALASVEAQDYPGRVHTYLVYWPRPEIEPLLASLGDGVTAIASVNEAGRNSLATKRNLAIDASSEDLIAFLDDDDLWHPSKLILQVSEVRSNGDLVAVGAEVVNFSDTPEWRGLERGVTSIGWYRRHLGHSLCTSSLLMSGPVLRDLRMDERPHWLGVSDYHLKLRLGTRGQLARVRAEVVGYRVGHNAMFASDGRHNFALVLSVLAGVGEAGVSPVARRLVAVHVGWAAIWSQIGLGEVSQRAIDRLRESLDGRLFGFLDRLLWRAIVWWWRLTVTWTGPRRFFGRIKRALAERSGH